MKKWFIVFLTLSATLLFSCGGKDNASAEKAAAPGEEEHAENSNTTEMTSDQLRTIDIQFGKVEDKQLTASLKANGVLQVPNQNKASINSVYSGVIRSLAVQPGETVRKGQVIATVSNPDFIRAQSEYLNLVSKLKLAELEVTRQQELNAGNAGALKNLQAAEAELRTLTTSRSTLEQQIRLMGVNTSSLSDNKLVSVLSITSPINGIVSKVNVKIGSYIDLTTTVAEIVDNSQLHLDLFVYEKDLPKLKDDQLIHFTLTNNPGKEYDAQIYSLGSSFEGESKAVTVHARVQGNKAGLIDGMSITALISLDKATVPAVPADAIVTWQGQDYIFRVAETKMEQRDSVTVFERIPVAKGTSDVGYTEVTMLKAIPADSRIVTKNAFFVLAKMTNVGENHH